MERGAISPPRRLLHALHAGLRWIATPVLGGLWGGWMRRLPVLPEWARRHHRAHVWPPHSCETPHDLLTVPGIWRDPAAEREAFERRPLHAFFQVHEEGEHDLWHHGWEFLLPTAPRYMRSLAQVRRADSRNARLNGDTGVPARTLAPAELAKLVREEARRLGLSEIGFAPYDPKYAWAEFAPRHETGSVIVCIYEQDYENSQTAPSARAERAAFYGYAELTHRTAALAEFVQDRLGGRAQPHDAIGEALVIPYAVRAGLGQLGLNGQLLTPAAGSRIRISLITTNVAFEHGEPQDFGVHRICDACQVCVRRCPVGAIPLHRAEHRGITKVKIKTERCFPVVSRVEGCAVCMKVCPVQKYGLDPVIAHYERTGEILGKGTDDLEGYRWPLDGRYYGAGSKPPIDASIIHPPGWVFDPDRTEPPSP